MVKVESEMVARSQRALRDGIAVVLAAALLAFLVRAFLLEPFVVHGISMQNTLQNHERVLVEKLSPRFIPLHYGEIVVFQPPLAGQGDYIKRVIATGGQTVSMVEGQVYVDGRKMPQAFLVRGGVTTMDHYTMPAFKVPAGDIFVLGDHRDVSDDSRLFGPVKLAAVQGVAFWAIWPLQNFGPIAQ